MDYRAKPTTLKCVECDFTCRSGNDMCRHIFSTGHGTRPCPTCGAVLVPRAFQASLQKLIERTPMGAPVGPTFAAAGPHTRIHAVGCEQCPGHPSFTFYEKNNFVVADTALELRPHSESATDALGSSTGGASSPQHSTVEGSNEKAFRCMECLNFCPTWTQVSKHIEQSGHTLAVCVQCERNLKCFGPQHPVQHEISHGHCGFFGVFYTRRDYRSDTQASRLVYNSANLFTGLTTLQYKCVCGLSFLHPVHLAHHLRSVHHVTCIRDSAQCHCCGMCGSLTELIAHLQRPCWEEDGGKAHPNMRRTTVPENALAVAALEIGIENAASDKDPIGLDTSAALSHAVEVVGFSGSAFLQFRPLLPPLTDEEVPLLGDAHALATAAGGSASASASATVAPPPQASYAVLYQCRECLFLFSNWDGIVQHIHATGHCRTFCTECNSFLPELLSQSASDGYAGWRSQPQPPNPHAAHQPPPLPAQEDNAAVVPGLGLSATLRDHLKHLRRHGDIIGYPASPETLEVLVDVRAACYTGTIDPATETFSAPRTLMVYQCSDFHDGCYKVFLHYGDFVAHLLTTGHGTKQVQRASPQTGKQVTLRALPTCYPMVSYRAKFTVMQLCEHFNFVQCPYCETAVPRAEEELHAALCVERRRHSASRGH